MVTVAVIGASGFIGRALEPALVRGGHTALPFDRTGWSGAVCPDLHDRNADWAEVLSESDVVINLAGKAHDVRGAGADEAAEYRAVNADGACRIAVGARQAGAKRFIQVSTIKVLGDRPTNGRRFLEGDPPSPVGVYAASKAEGERRVADALADGDTECVVVRLPLVLGQPFKGNLALMERAIRRGLPLPLGDKRIGARTYVKIDDLVGLIMLLVESPAPLPRIVHARSEPDLPAGEVACIVAAAVGREPVLVKVPPALLHRVARLLGRPEMASKLCDEMLVSDEATRKALAALAG